MKKKITFFLALSFALNGIAQISKQVAELDPQALHPIDGVDWSSNIVTSFKTGAMYFAYINPELNGVVMQKQPDGTVNSTIVIPNIVEDEHHSEISLAIDNDGYLHVTAGNHNSPTRYYVSAKPENLEKFIQKDNIQSIGGIPGAQVTYLTFYKSNKGTLFATYRNAVIEEYVTGSRALMLAKYDTQTKKWNLMGGKNYAGYGSSSCDLITGEQLQLNAFVWNNSGVGNMESTGKCHTSAAYQGYKLKILFDKNNGMHVTYNMADSINSTGTASESMTHTFYAFSPDEGTTWRKANGNTINSFPITKSSGDLVLKHYPTGYQYPNTTTVKTMPNAPFLLLDVDNKPIVIQKTLDTNKNRYFKYLNGSWKEVGSNYVLNGTPINTERLFTNFKRNEINGFLAGGTLQLSKNEMSSWYFSTTPTYKISTTAIIDRYFLLKTGHLRYYSRNDAAQTAQPATVWFTNTDVTAPSAPTELKTTQISNNQVTVQWNASDSYDAVLYYIYVNNSVIDSTENQIFTLKDLNPGSPYEIKVKVRDYYNNYSGFSNIVTCNTTNTPINLQKPVNIRAEQIGNNFVVLNWESANPTVLDEKFEVFVNNNKLDSDFPSIKITGLNAESFYNVKIRSSLDESIFSEFDSITVHTLSNNLIVYEPYNYELNQAPGLQQVFGNGLPAIQSNGSRMGTGLRAYIQPSIVVQGLEYPGIETKGGALQITNNTWSTASPVYRYRSDDPFLSYRVSNDDQNGFGVTDSVLYVSLLAKYTNAADNAFRFLISSKSYRNIYVHNTVSGKWAITDNESDPVVSNADAKEGETALLMLKFEFKTGAQDKVSFWKNPSLNETLGKENASLIIGADFDIYSFYTLPAIANNMFIDELRMGSTPASVLPVKSDGSNISSLRNIESDNITVRYNNLSNSVFISSNTDMKMIELYDINGRKVQQERINAFNHILNVKGHKQGVYLIRIITSTNISTKKLLF